MSKYRIKKIEGYSGIYFILQKRLFGLLWWYNPDNFDSCITGIYDTKAEVDDAYKRKMHTTKITILPCEIVESSKDKDK